MQFQSLISGAKSTKSIFSDKNVTFLAGSIAYSAFVSLVPLVMFFLLAVSIFGVPELQQRIVTVATESVSPSVGGVIEVMIEQQSGSSSGSTIGASIIGVLTLVWGAIKVFRGLDTAFSEIYETTAQESFVGQVKNAGQDVLPAIGQEAHHDQSRHEQDEEQQQIQEWRHGGPLCVGVESARWLLAGQTGPK